MCGELVLQKSIELNKALEEQEDLRNNQDRTGQIQRITLAESNLTVNTTWLEPPSEYGPA